MKDAAIRHRIGPWAADGAPDLDAFEPDTNFVVQAAAGSGKTTALVARMVALVRSGVPVDRIAAITFTRKAAGEMNERFFAELQTARAALRDAGRTDEAARVQHALDDLQRCFIGTIHAFCARLLRERPLDAQIPPDFTAGIDDRDERQLRQRAWSSYLSDTWSERPEAFDRLSDAGLSADDLTDFFADLCRDPELTPFVDGPADPSDVDPVLDRAVDATHDLVDTWLAQRPAVPPDTSPGAALEALETADRFRQYRSLDDRATRAEYVGLFEKLLKTDRRTSTDTDERGDVKLKAWGDRRDAAKRLGDDVLPPFVQDVIRPALRTWRAYVHRVAVDFARPAVDRFAALRRQEGQLTFQDLLLVARDLLRDHPDVRRHFQDRFRYLLVDEFQDTDPVQAELLFYLTASDLDETNWRRCTPRPGRLFIVGDDKQSIYRFRRADMQVFEDVGTLVDASSGEEVELTTNFRSVKPLLDWCNDAFGTLYANPETDDIQADYAPFDAHRDAPEDRADPRPIRQLRTEKVRYNRADAIAESEAERIARYVGAEVEAERSYGDFLILTRLSKRLKTYAQALSARGIPYTITGSKDLNDSAELRALVDLLTCVERPDDPVACVAYLRGRLVGFSDDALYRLHRAGVDFNAIHVGEPNDLEDGLRDRFDVARRHLTQAREWLDTLSPGAAVETILDATGLWAAAAHPLDGGADGSLRAGQLVRALTLVQHFDAQNLHWTDIREELQRVLDGDETVDGMTLETGTSDAVRLMNVHQAKGLQAPVVFLADPYDGYHRPTPDRHVRREEGDVILPVERRFGAGRSTTLAAPEAWETIYADEEKRHHDAEETRLQYVAATRAEDLLVVSRYDAKDDGFWGDLYPFLDAHDVADLDVPDADTVSTPETPAPPLDADRERRAERLDHVAGPSYAVQSVTDVAADVAKDASTEETALRVDGERRGAAFGTAVHTLLESLVRRRTHPDRVATRAFVVRTLRDAGASADHAKEAQAILADFRASTLWERLTEADRVWTEYPVAQIDAVDDGPTQITTGQIDLLVETDAGWLLVDYKTDAVDPDAIPAPYVEQVRRYADAWRDTGEPVAAAALWLTASATRVDVDGAAS